MKIEDIQDRITKKQAQIEKINKRIKKWEDAKTEKAFRKHYDWFIHSEDEYPGIKERFFDSYIKECEVEKHRAERDLQDAMNQLQKYQGMLQGETVKANTEKIPAIVDFLEEWKKQATAYIEKDMELVNKYHKVEREYTTKYNDWTYRKEHKEEISDLGKQIRYLRDTIHPWTFEVQANTYEKDENGYSKWVKSEVNYSKLKEILDKEAENKYWDLVNRIQKLAGTIVDAQMLKIGPKGNLEGVVVGDQEKVHVETIVAGGWNAGRIVNVKRGPIAHYRTIVNVIHG